MPSPWVWIPSSRRYHNTVTGRFLGHIDMVALRDTYLDAKLDMAKQLAQRLSMGDITLGEWHNQMREDIKRSFIDQYVLGHGGRGTMTQADWGRVGAMCKEQYGKGKYLDAFAAAIKDGDLTAAQIGARGGLYHNASTQAYEKANARAHGVPRLPYYPGDGSTECQTNCRCHWDIRETAEGWDCWWIIDPAAEHCDTCMERAAEDAPRVVSRG